MQQGRLHLTRPILLRYQLGTCGGAIIIINEPFFVFRLSLSLRECSETRMRCCFVYECASICVYLSVCVCLCVRACVCTIDPKYTYTKTSLITVVVHVIITDQRNQTACYTGQPIVHDKKPTTRYLRTERCSKLNVLGRLLINLSNVTKESNLYCCCQCDYSLSIKLIHANSVCTKFW